MVITLENFINEYLVCCSMDKNYYKRMVDMAYKSEGLPELLNGKDPRGNVLEESQLIFLFLQPTPNLDESHEKMLRMLYDFAERVCSDYNYDSGKRKYGVLPVDGSAELKPVSKDELELTREANRMMLVVNKLSEII